MTAATRHELPPYRQHFFPLTVDQYHQMIATGILPEGEPYELIDGNIVRKDRSAAGEDPMTVGEKHAWTVKTLATLDSKFERFGCHVQTQQPITLPPHHEPEPDAAIVIGSKDDYRTRHPAAGDVLCMIEVADASLAQDRTVKQRIYCDAGIPMYVIFNLPDKVVEVYTEPMIGKGRYGRCVTLSGRQSIAFPAPRGKELSVPVRKLLP